MIKFKEYVLIKENIVKRIDDFYLRFGDLPSGDFSAIAPFHKGDPVTYEKGISCFYARWNEEYQRWMADGMTHQQLVSLNDIIERPIYLITGEEIGYGSDDEPLLKKNSIKILAKLKPNDFYDPDNEEILFEYPRLTKPIPEWNDLENKVKFIKKVISRFGASNPNSELLSDYKTELYRINDEYIKRNRQWVKDHVLKSDVSPDRFMSLT
jgi:hypothetical protein